MAPLHWAALLAALSLGCGQPAAPATPPAPAAEAEPATPVAPQATSAEPTPAPTTTAQPKPAATGTALNSKKWRVAAYVNRLKRSIYAQWTPPSLTTGRTIVDMSVDKSGGLLDVTIADSSGDSNLDKSALAACRAAAPFGPMPAGLADADGVWRFKFGFDATR